MEKRVVIAFILSFLILLIWSLLVPTKKQPPPKEERPPIQKEAERPAPPVTSAAKSAAPFKRDKTITSNIEEREVKVETPLYRAIFSNLGPSIKSFQLKNYHLTTDPQSPLIELVDLGKSGEDFLKIDFDGESNPNEKLTYHVDEDSILLDPSSSPRDLTFTSLRDDGVSVNQTFHFYPDKYQVGLSISLNNHSEKQVVGNLRAYIKNIPPKKSGYYSFVGVALLLNEKLEEIKPDEMKEEGNRSGRIGWMAFEDQYFMSAIVPDDETKGSFRGELLPSGVLEAAYIAPSISLRSREQISSRFTLYLGPRDLSLLKQVGKKGDSSPNLEKAVHFGWFDIIAKPLHYALRFFNKYAKNYGLSIILLTILIKIIFWPLTHKSYKSMKEMQKLQPLIAKIREKYKNDKQKMNKEVMALYRTYKVNPVGGCLPMVIQIPVFFALFRILGNSIELRHAPFMLWINDLSAPDRLFSFPPEMVPWPISLMTPPYGIPVLTLLMGASMFIQQKMTPTPGDPTQAKVMMFLPIMFTFLFINFASGLVLYWFVNNILSIGQQYRIKRSPA
jgi:YidC/Oxa1 family membrane protein insertase